MQQYGCDHGVLREGSGEVLLLSQKHLRSGCAVYWSTSDREEVYSFVASLSRMGEVTVGS